MSEPGRMPASNEERARPNDDRQDKPDQRQAQSVWLNPVTTAEFLLTKMYQGCTHKRVGNNRPNTSRPFLAGAATFIIVAAVVAAVAYGAYLCGLLRSPDHVIAVFSFVLAVIAGVQWWTSYLQWHAMHEQNVIMSAQTKQTDAMIEQMELENRAWLAIVDIKIKTLAPGYRKVNCTITVKNSGKTPGKIYAGLIRHYVHPIDVLGDVAIHEFESEPSQPQVHNVNPGEGIIIEMEPLGEVDDLHIEDIRLGKRHLHILARFAYRTINGETDEEKAFYTSKGLGSEMRRRANYCSIH